MKVQDLMSTNVRCCKSEDTLSAAAQQMWEGDCGAVPVVDNDSQVVGMLTDRDLSMAAFLQGKRLDQIPVEMVMARTVFAVKPKDDVSVAERLMRSNAVRRVPVVEDDGRLAGILSLNDIVRETVRQRERKTRDLTVDGLADTLAGISQPRGAHARVAKG